MTVRLSGGAASLADWRAIYAGAGVALDPASDCARRSGRRRRRAHHRARRAGLWGEHRFRQARQRPHRRRGPRPAPAQHRAFSCRRRRRTRVRRRNAAHDGAEARFAGAGRSGVRPATLALLEAMLNRGVTPVVPAQGSVGASGDLAPARPYDRGDDRRRRGALRRRRPPGVGRPRTRRPCSLRARPEGGARAPQRHAVLDRARARGPVRGRTRVSRGARDRRPLDRRGARLRRSRSIRASWRCAGIAARARSRRPSPRLWPAARSASPTATAIRACRTPIACAASRR